MYDKWSVLWPFVFAQPFLKVAAGIVLHEAKL